MGVKRACFPSVVGVARSLRPWSLMSSAVKYSGRIGGAALNGRRDRRSDRGVYLDFLGVQGLQSRKFYGGLFRNE